MALPVLEGIASVFGAAVPAYQQARDFVLKSQEAALDYRIAVANLITRLRTEELANAARMRAAAADAVSNVRRSFGLTSAEYEMAETELTSLNIPDEQKKAILDAINAQGVIYEDQIDSIFSMQKADGLGGAGGRGQDDYFLDPDYFNLELGQLNTRINNNRRQIDIYLEQRRDDSEYGSMSPAQQRGLLSDIRDLQEENNALLRDWRQLQASRDFVESRRNQGIPTTLGEVIAEFPLSRHSRANSRNAGTTVATPRPLINQDPNLVWDGSTPNPNVFNQDLERARRDSARVNEAIVIDAPVYEAKQ